MLGPKITPQMDQQRDFQTRAVAYDSTQGPISAHKIEGKTVWGAPSFPVCGLAQLLWGRPFGGSEPPGTSVRRGGFGGGLRGQLF